MVRDRFAYKPLPAELGGPTPGTKCDPCGERGVVRAAVADRKVGGVWMYVCGYCRRRIDSRSGS